MLCFSFSNSVLYFDFQYALKRQDSKLLQSQDQLLPFEDILPVERLAHEHDASLFAYASHSKKRPNNLILGMFLFVCYFWLLYKLAKEELKAVLYELATCVVAKQKFFKVNKAISWGFSKGQNDYISKPMIAYLY